MGQDGKVKKKFFGRFDVGFILLFIVVLVLRYFVYAPVVVKGDSMRTTLYDGDRLITNKLNNTERFDIVVFKNVDGDNYIKRVIGVAGDYIEYKNDELYINGTQYNEGYLDEQKNNLSPGEVLTPDFSLVSLTSTMSTEVPEGHYFVLGDNRRNSKDSRELGFIKADNIIGRASFLFWPLRDFGIVR